MDKLERYLMEYTDAHPVRLDHSRIIYISNRAGSPQMWEKNLATGENKQRTFFNSKVVNMVPYREGKKILFTLDADGSEIAKMAFDRLGLTARSFDRLLRVARTIADMEGSETIQANHIAEAIGYRELNVNP